MRAIVNLATCLLLTTVPAVCYAQQAANAQQALQGLLTGDKVQDRLLIEAFQRGYQRGLEDAQRQCKAGDRQSYERLQEEEVKRWSIDIHPNCDRGATNEVTP